VNLEYLLPAVVFVLYLITAVCYAMKHNWAWALVWFSYAMANLGLIIAAKK